MEKITVAVAGGTGGVGRTILDQLERASKWQLIVLTRSDPKVAQSAAGTKYIRVDYGDDKIDELAAVLRDHNVHTVVSSIAIISDDTSRAQCNLIRAAIESSTTRRFIPSEYGYVNVPEILPLDPTVQRWINAAALLETSSLQYTRVANGFFMDYWGMPHVSTHLGDFSWAIDLAHRTAAIPGDGEAVITLTHSVDLGRAIVRLLDDDDEWPEWSIVAGEDVTFNQFLTIAERVRESKFTVTYDTLADLEAGKVTLLPKPGSTTVEAADPTMKDMLALFGRLYVKGILHMPTKDRVSDRWPDMTVTKLEGFLAEAWKGRL